MREQLRPRIYRDPVHGDIAFPRDGFEKQIREIIDTRAFQRLRHIRENGLANLVFHGAEHSRFGHSMGVGWLAGGMFDAASRSLSEPPSETERQDAVLAGLLHDIGHGPFSHTFEELCQEVGNKRFSHEDMTVRILTEEGSEVAARLRRDDADRPERLVPYIEKKRREDHRWSYSLVSSQLDADRLDYIQRDCLMTGYRGPFDLQRLVGALHVVQSPWIKGRLVVALDARAVDMLESLILTMDQLYEFVYYHHTVRGASRVFMAAVQRAMDLARQSKRGKAALFPDLGGFSDPLWQVIEQGSRVPLEVYYRLDDPHVWGLLSRWEGAPDRQLQQLVNTLWDRGKFPRFLPLEGVSSTGLLKLQEKAAQLCKKKKLEPKYFVWLDDPARVSFKRWNPGEGPDEGILIIERNGKIQSLERRNRTITGIMSQRNIVERLFFPRELEPELREFAEKERLL